MNENQFWSIIAESRVQLSNETREGNFAKQLKQIKHLLSALTDSDLVEFDRIFTTKLHDAYRWDLWGAAYVIGGGCSDDGFTDFRAWLISMGRSVYESALEDPESLVDVDQRNDFDDYFFEQFLGVSHNIRDYPLQTADVPHPTEPAGEYWDDELERLFPGLTAIHGKAH